MTTLILTDLISRLSAATGPSRELDGDIALAFDLVPPGTERADDAWWGGGGEQWEAPSYTKSIDAAMTLVPKGWRVFELCEWDGIEPCGWHCKLRRKNLVTPVEVSAGWPEDNDDRRTKQLPIPAIALVIACLKAKEDNHDR